MLKKYYRTLKSLYNWLGECLIDICIGNVKNNIVNIDDTTSFLEECRRDIKIILRSIELSNSDDTDSILALIYKTKYGKFNKATEIVKVILERSPPEQD